MSLYDLEAMARVVAYRVKSYRFSLTSIEISATLNLKFANRKLFCYQCMLK